MLHIGNYTGALSVWAAGQDDYENLFSVGDMYALKDPEAVRPAALRDKTLEFAALYLACGIDPKKSTVFIQSQIPAQAELAWILSCLTPLEGLLNMEHDPVGVSTGVLTLPVLLAADMMLYDADLVPIGEDQRRHLDFVIAAAQRFNALYEPVMHPPEPLIRERGALIMGLDDPTVKMSKSIGETRKGHMIGLLDRPEDIRSAVMSAATGPGDRVNIEDPHAGVKNLLVLFEVISGASRSDVEARFDGVSIGELKEDLAELLIATLEPIQNQYVEIRDDADYLDSVLAAGAERALEIAEPRIRKIKECVGFVPGDITA